MSQDPSAERTCAVTRVQHDPGDLIRFVAGPDGSVVPDLARKLPGRGVWITAEQAVVELAVHRNVFAKSMKRQLKVAPNLADLVDRLIERRVTDALSIATKAGLVSSGFVQVEAALGKGRVAMLLHGSDGTAGGREKLDRKFTAIASSTGRVPVISTELTVEQMSLAIGGSNVVHAALNHGGAAAKFATEIGRLRRYRSGARPLAAD